MRKGRVPILALGLLLAACTQQPAPVTNAQGGEKDAIAAVMNDYHRGLIQKNADRMLGTLDDDGLFLGTDPNEFFTKKQLTDYLKRPFADTTTYEPYTVVREIRPGPDGKTALVVEQYLFKEVSPVIPIRGVGHLVKKDGRWLIDFYSLSLAPRNEDLNRINQAAR